MASKSDLQITAVKWQNRAATLRSHGVPDGVWKPLAERDIKGVMQGHSPIGDREISDALAATLHTAPGSISRSPITDPHKGTDWWDVIGNIPSDIKNIVTGFVPGAVGYISTLPEQAHGFVGLTGILGKEEQAREQAKYQIVPGMDAGDFIRNLSHVPVFSPLIPGIHTIGNLTTPEGRNEIVQHPVSTALDVGAALTLGGKAGLFGTQAGLAEEAARTTLKAPEYGMLLNDEHTPTPFKNVLQQVGAPLNEPLIDMKTGQFGDVVDVSFNDMGREYGPTALERIDKEHLPNATQALQAATTDEAKALAATDVEALQIGRSALRKTIFKDKYVAPETPTIRGALQRGEPWRAAGRTLLGGAERVPGTNINRVTIRNTLIRMGFPHPDLIERFARPYQEIRNRNLREMNQHMQSEVVAPVLKLAADDPERYDLFNRVMTAQTALSEEEMALLQQHGFIEQAAGTDRPLFPDARPSHVSDAGRAALSDPNVDPSLKTAIQKAVDNEVWDNSPDLQAISRRARDYMDSMARDDPNLVAVRADWAEPWGREYFYHKSHDVAKAWNVQVEAYRALDQAVEDATQARARLSHMQAARQAGEAVNPLDEMLARQAAEGSIARLKKATTEAENARSAYYSEFHQRSPAAFYGVLAENTRGEASDYAREAPQRAADIQRQIDELAAQRDELHSRQPLSIDEQRTLNLQTKLTVMHGLRSAISDTGSPFAPLVDEAGNPTAVFHDFGTQIADAIDVDLQFWRNAQQRLSEGGHPWIPLVQGGVENRFGPVAIEDAIRELETAKSGIQKLQAHEELLAKEGPRIHSQITDLHQRMRDEGPQFPLEEALNRVQGAVDWHDLEVAIGPEAQRLRTEMEATWTALAANGVDPIFLPNTKAARVEQVHLPTVIPDSPQALAHQSKNTSFNLSRSVYDVAVGLVESKRQQLTEAGTREFATRWVRPWARQTTDARNEIQDGIRNGGPTTLDVRHVAEQEMNRVYEKWNPDDHGLGVYFPTVEGGEWQMPAGVARAMRQLAREEGTHNPIRVQFDKVMKVWRFSVLTTPRHISHVTLGGAMMGILRDPFFIPRFITNFKEAYGIMTGDEHTLLAKFGGNINDFELDQLYAIGAAKSMGRTANAITRAVRGVNRFEESAVTMYKITQMLAHEKELARIRGVPTSLVRDEAIAMANKMFIDMNSLSPLERVYIRKIFPFYGFTRHLFRYLMTYPADHPYAAAILTNFAVQHEEDWDSGLPRDLSFMFYLGQPDADGNVNAVDYRSIDPFRSFYNTFTLAGFFSQVNPAVQLAAQQAGINVLSATAELYPDQHYNPTTGQMEADQPPNLPLRLLETFIPTTVALDAKFALTDQFRNLKLSDPQGYKHRLYTALGIPFSGFPFTLASGEVGEKINVYQKTQTAQMKRYRDAQDSINQAIQSGDFTRAMRYEYVPVPTLLTPYIRKEYEQPAVIEKVYRALEQRLGTKGKGISLHAILNKPTRRRTG